MSQTTPIAQLLQEDRETEQRTGESAQTMPPNVQAMHAIQAMQAQQAQQAQQAAVAAQSGSKETFGLSTIKEFDWKSTFLVFIIVLLLSSSMFTSCVKYAPGAVGSDGRTGVVGSLIAAVIGALLFVIVKLIGKF